MPQTQNYSNHVRFDPLFHGFLGPVALAATIVMIYRAVVGPSFDSIFHVVIALWAVIAAFKIRLYALKVQDRVIRLEERLRLQQVLSADMRSRIGELTEGQLIGLRFASDAELPGLAQKTLAEKLDGKQIKQAVKDWRADLFRV
jgi:hypothetical protein